MPSCERPVGECVMFGGQEKNAEQHAADKRFLDEFDTPEKRREAVLLYVFRGAEAIEADDLLTSIARYNQAWLIDPDEPAVYWGFALLMAARRDDAGETRDMFDYAAALNAGKPRFFRDYGFWLARRGEMAAAIERFEESERLDPEQPDVLMMLSMAHLRLDDVAQARVYFDRAVTAGHPTDLDFIEAHEGALKKAETGG